MTATENKLVKVVYWAGTQQREALASDYAEAMELAGRNQNAYDPAFYEISTGKQLHDDGNGLRYEDQSVYVV
jgi:hypothetical protein